MSLVQDATHIMVLRSMDLAELGFMEVLPKALEYVKEPGVLLVLEVGYRNGKMCCVPSRLVAAKAHPGISCAAMASLMTVSKSAMVVVNT